MKRKPLPPPPEPPPPRYREWLTHVFDRPVTDPGWYFPQDVMQDVRFRATPEELAALFIHTMRHCKADLGAFSDGQVKHGLTYMISNSCSNVSIDVKAEALGIDVRKSVLLSISTLYTDCFELRCAPVLSHVDEPGANPVNSICYMFWDVTPLLHWRKDRNCAVFDDTVIEVLKAALAGSRNPACVESALHGFGHLRQIMGPSSPVEAIVTRFIETRPARPQLKAYAAQAAKGMVL